NAQKDGRLRVLPADKILVLVQVRRSRSMETHQFMPGARRAMRCGASGIGRHDVGALVRAGDSACFLSGHATDRRQSL
ncbi:MAG: hypothetical protein ABJN42_02220, partial [Roseibium sp.]|uniref:hypothetical protein n=1 Tax=Roseibium sp. TaxID=1936156 RepID=UPI0032969630